MICQAPQPSRPALDFTFTLMINLSLTPGRDGCHRYHCRFRLITYIVMKLFR
jgi:hypothetical protein